MGTLNHGIPESSIAGDPFGVQSSHDRGCGIHAHTGYGMAVDSPDDSAEHKKSNPD